MQRYPYKDTYDPAPYSALGGEHRAGVDITERVVDIIVTTRTRPGFMAKRLNSAGIPVPHGGEWTWIDVRDLAFREKERRKAQAWSDWIARVGTKAMAVRELPPDRRDDPNWWPDEEVIETPLGPMTRGEIKDCKQPLPSTVAGRRQLWNHIKGG